MGVIRIGAHTAAYQGWCTRALPCRSSPRRETRSGKAFMSGDTIEVDISLDAPALVPGDTASLRFRMTTRAPLRIRGAHAGGPPGELLRGEGESRLRGDDHARHSRGPRLQARGRDPRCAVVRRSHDESRASDDPVPGGALSARVEHDPILRLTGRRDRQLLDFRFLTFKNSFVEHVGVE